jgi:hypothetical protein
MILVDAGPLVALLNRGEQDHERCVSALQQMMAPMITPGRLIQKRCTCSPGASDGCATESPDIPVRQCQEMTREVKGPTQSKSSRASPRA